MSFDSIKNIFLTFNKPDPLTDYVECIDLKSIPKDITIWRTHTDSYVDISSRLSLCAHYQNKLRECSIPLAKKYYVSYRRLEYYAEFTGQIDRPFKDWIGFGKIVEFTVYLKYESIKRASWSRHYEIRMYISAPLGLTEYYKVFDKKTIVKTAQNVLESLGLPYILIKSLEIVKEKDKSGAEREKVGVREISSRVISFGEGAYNKLIPREYIPYTFGFLYPNISEYWCNRIARGSYDSAYFIVYDYISDRIFFAEDYFKPFEVKEILSLLYDKILEKYRYW